MADADRNAVEAFDCFLDALAGEPNAPPADVPPDVAAAARRFHAMASARLPSSSRERVWQALTASSDSTALGKGPAMFLPGSRLRRQPVTGANGRVALPVPRLVPRKRTSWPANRPRVLVWGALSALLLVALVGGWLAFGDRWPGGDGERSARLAAPTAVGAATPAMATSADQTLLSTIVDRADLPQNPGFVSFLRNTAEPGSRHFGGERGEVGTFVYVVEAGKLTLNLEEGGRIVRAAHTDAPREETAPVGTDIHLGPGDAALIPPQPRSEGNTGVEPAVYLVMVVLESIGPPTGSDPRNVGVITGETLPPQAAVYPWELPPGSVEVTLRRTVLESEASLPAPVGGTQSAGAESGSDIALVDRLDRTVVNLGAEPIVILLMTFVPVGHAASPVASPVP